MNLLDEKFGLYCKIIQIGLPRLKKKKKKKKGERKIKEKNEFLLKLLDSNN